MWIPIHRNMPRVERFGIGTRIDTKFLDLLNLLRKAAYARAEDKVEPLKNAVSTLDSLRFFLQLSWEVSLIPNKQYTRLGKDVEEIGRMVGGWKKGIEKKTSAR